MPTIYFLLNCIRELYFLLFSFSVSAQPTEWQDCTSISGVAIFSKEMHKLTEGITFILLTFCVKSKFVQVWI